MLYLFTALLLSTTPIYASADATPAHEDEIPPGGIRPCARCVEARENNLKHPNEYFYYEDYVEAKEKNKK